MERGRSHWLFHRTLDLGILFLPVWLTWLVCFALPSDVLQAEVPLWVWVVFILGIDVSHVWSTLFRTYLDPEERSRHRKLLLLTPILCFLVLFGVAGISVSWFWRILAYVAVFHFIKQQYGFFALYRYRSGIRLTKRFFRDKWVIYFSMLYPVLYWHLSGDRQFTWMTDGDFFSLPFDFSMDQVLLWGNGIYWLIMAGWILEDVSLTRKQGTQPSIGKHLWFLTTALNWYLGIVWFNSDLAFTLTNVVAHGLPYIALIMFYRSKKEALSTTASPSAISKQVLKHFWLIPAILLLALGEEYLWDMTLFREKGAFFEAFFHYPVQVLEHPVGQAIAYALLALPQVSHYVIDGFIWRFGASNPELSKIFTPQPGGNS